MTKLIARMGEETLLAYAFYLAGIRFMLVPLFSQMVMLGVIAFIFGLGMGCGQPITTMLLFNHSPEGRSGETFGLRQTVNNVMRVSAPTVFGFIASAFGLVPVFIISGLLMASGGALTRPKRTPAS